MSKRSKREEKKTWWSWETKENIKQDLRERDVQYGIIVLVVIFLGLILLILENIWKNIFWIFYLENSNDYNYKLPRSK